MAYYHLLSEILSAEGNPEKTVEAYKKVGGPDVSIGIMYTLIMNGVPSTYDIPARAYLNKGDIDKAIAEYEQLVSPDPLTRKFRLIHPQSRFLLAQLYEKKGLRAKALEQYKALAVIWKDADPDFAEAREVKQRLAALKAV
jgi:tetratricopeptide (TPR) repeat protein